MSCFLIYSFHFFHSYFRHTKKRERPRKKILPFSSEKIFFLCFAVYRHVIFSLVVLFGRYLSAAESVESDDLKCASYWSSGRDIYIVPKIIFASTAIHKNSHGWWASFVYMQEFFYRIVTHIKMLYIEYFPLANICNSGKMFKKSLSRFHSTIEFEKKEKKMYIYTRILIRPEYDIYI